MGINSSRSAWVSWSGSWPWRMESLSWEEESVTKCGSTRVAMASSGMESGIVLVGVCILSFDGSTKDELCWPWRQKGIKRERSTTKECLRTPLNFYSYKDVVRRCHICRILSPSTASSTECFWWGCTILDHSYCKMFQQMHPSHADALILLSLITGTFFLQHCINPIHRSYSSQQKCSVSLIPSPSFISLSCTIIKTIMYIARSTFLLWNIYSNRVSRAMDAWQYSIFARWLFWAAVIKWAIWQWYDSQIQIWILLRQ